MERDFENAIQAYWKKVQELYAPYVAEGGLLANRDFYVFQTQYRFQPDLMIIGINPGGNGKEHGGWLTQDVNSYVVGQHPWFDTLRKAFGYPNDQELAPILENCVGSNKFFVNTGAEKDVPKEVNRMSVSLIRELVDIVQPKHIVTLGSNIFKSLKNKPHQSNTFGSIKLQTSHWNDIPVAYVPNPSRINQGYFTPGRTELWHQALRWFLLER